MISGLLLDLSGVLYIDNKPVEGAKESLLRLQKLDIPLRYVTNTTRTPRVKIHQQLNELGFDIHLSELYTAPMAARAYLDAHNLSPYMLIHPDLEHEFTGFNKEPYNAVLIGDAEQGFTYNNMNKAFRLLIQGFPFIAMGKNRYFMQHDGLSIDAGAFVTALEYAADTKAIITGKPDPEFFLAAVNDMNSNVESTFMIGDDVDADINAAINAGLGAILVQTGKYRESDEDRIKQPSAICVQDFNHAVDWVINDK